MIGRPRKPHTKIFRSFEIETRSGDKKKLKEIIICCPICHSSHIGNNGTRKRGNTRVQIYQCKNPECSFLQHANQGKQFTIYSSLVIQRIVDHYLQIILAKLFKSEGKLINIGKHYSISPSLMSYLNKKFQDALDHHHGLQNLVDQQQEERAISLDETFLKINGKSVYIIMATGYATHKVLGLKVSKTRKWEDIRDVILEADSNSLKKIEIITADAWNGTRACVKKLNRPITLIMHKHKKPYEDVVIERYNYKNNYRITTTIGVKSDFVKKRATRQYFYKETIDNLISPPKKKRGRPKGVKNGQRKKKRRPRVKKKRGRKGFRTVFDKGKRGYAKVDPYRKTVRVGKEISPAVTAALGEVINLYALKYIQNNLAEHKNSLLSNLIILTGPKTVKSIEKRIRACIICQNNPTLLDSLMIPHKFQHSFLDDQILNSPLLDMMVC